MKKIVTAIAIIVVFASCGVPKNFQKNGYLQDSVTEAAKIILDKPITIEPGDRLSIDITAINKEAATAFTVSGAAGASTGTAGYLVDSAGDIELLQLGKIKVGGLTTPQVKAEIEARLADYLKGPIVTVNIINFKVNMMGEIGSPGVLTVPDGKITILQAITQSGDMTQWGKRENILVIREVNGKREFGRVNINSNHVFESPYYNLKQNDIVYVEADKAKYINNNPTLDRNLRNLAVATTLLTTVLLVLNLFNHN